MRLFDPKSTDLPLFKEMLKLSTDTLLEAAVLSHLYYMYCINRRQHSQLKYTF